VSPEPIRSCILFSATGDEQTAVPSLWRTIANIRTGEGRALLGPAALFFLVLAALMLLRPARESVGLAGGIESVRWMFTITMVAMFAINPAFAWLVARFPRTVFVPATFAFLSLNLVGFFVLATGWPDAVGATSGRVFYVWTSVVNFLAVSVFWALLADRFTLEASRRLFGMVAVGGTLGAISGSAAATMISQPWGTASLLAVAAALLALAAIVAWFVASGAPVGEGARRDQAAHADGARRIIGGSIWRGVIDTLRSPYLLGICAFIMLTAVMATFLYFAQLSLVAAHAEEMDARTATFAQIDLWTQIATLALQAIVAGHLMRRVGVGVALAMLPAVTLVGFTALAIAPGLAVLVLVQAAFKAVQRAIARPARETLFTVVTPEERYKAKVLIDTFVYRTGDVVGAQADRPLTQLAPGLTGVLVAVVPLSIAWIALSLWLGRAQSRRADTDPSRPDSPDALESHDATVAANVA